MKIFLMLLSTTIAASCAGGAHGWWRPEVLGTMLSTKAAGVADEPHREGKGAIVRELKPIITNLAAPDGAWIRLEIVLVLGPGFGPESETQIVAFLDDTVSYLRSVTAARLEGGSGLRELREDLKERATLRSNGCIDEVLIVTMVVQ